MTPQAKRDMMAAAATVLMFLGAFLLTTSAFGFALIAAGGLTWIALFVIQLMAKS